MNIWWGRRWLKLGYAALREYNRRQRQRERERNRQAGVAGAAPQYPARQQYPTWQREKAEGEYRAWEREQNKQQVRRSVAPTQVETRQQQHENEKKLKHFSAEQRAISRRYLLPGEGVAAPQPQPQPQTKIINLPSGRQRTYKNVNGFWVPM